MLSNQKFLKITISTLMALLSAAWTLPFFAAAHCILGFFKNQEDQMVRETHPEYIHGAPFSTIELSGWFLVIAEILLVIVVLFWSFIASWKLLHPKKKIAP